MQIKSPISSPFKGQTKIYAMSDSHQETRKTASLLSRVLEETKNEKNVLLLNCGDIFKGIYPRELEKDCYIKIKEAKPDLEIAMTLGNNDFGFDRESLDYLINTAQTFNEKGIHLVCANIFEESGQRPFWLKPYTIIERGGDRNFICGFCIDNINTKKFGIIPKKSHEIIDEINDAITKENPDNVIILNHDYMDASRMLADNYKKRGTNVDIIIGGHDHEVVPPDENMHIYYPRSFSNSMLRFKLFNHDSKKIREIKEIKSDETALHQVFAKDIEEYEKKSKLLEAITPFTLDLPKQYSSSSPLGSFMADEMQKRAKTDIAFFSTGFLMYPLRYRPDAFITNYLFKKTIIAQTPVKITKLNAAQLTEIFSHALKNYNNGVNPKFLQCSNNIKIEGAKISPDEPFKIKQIYINNEKLLDESQNPRFPDKTYICAIDSYIDEGGQGFLTLANAKSYPAEENGKILKINEVLKQGLIDASEKYKKGDSYPCFEIVETSCNSGIVHY